MLTFPSGCSKVRAKYIFLVKQTHLYSFNHFTCLQNFANPLAHLLILKGVRLSREDPLEFCLFFEVLI